MNCRGEGDKVRLDQLPLRRKSMIAGIDWDSLRPRERQRLQELGFGSGVEVEALHRGALLGPIACRVGRMIVALRRAQAAAIMVSPA